MFTAYNLCGILNIIVKEVLRRFGFNFFSVFIKLFVFIGAISANTIKSVATFAGKFTFVTTEV
ncbi:MAG: hypothetical protein Q7V19_15260, partial [Bacteroidales bacterium]|nr:hypothetical protein [Bacteroidales bacterium]